MQGNQSLIKQRLNQKRNLRLWIFLLVVVLSAIAIFLFYPRPDGVKRESNYTIHTRQEFNQPQFYPVTTTENLTIYRPVAEWVGKLILPTKEQMQQKGDWSWFLVQHAPTTAQNLIGQTVRLEWKNQPEIQSYLKATTRDIRFTPGAKKTQKKGIVLPDRLDNRLHVGPLQSLAGARPNDDMIVSLDNVQVVAQSDGKPALQIEREPILATGRFYGLVKILKPEATSSTYPALKNCPGKQPCPSDYFQVRHYNPASGNFDGAVGTVRIPQQVLDTRAFFQFAPRQIETSPAGTQGWYIYGAINTKGIFVAQGLVPRSLVQIQPDRVLLGTEAGLKYIKAENWLNTPQKKGKLEKVLVDGTAMRSAQALSYWQPGDKAILMHLYGAVGGKKGELGALKLLSTVPGHFAFGLAEVVRDPFTQELQFDINYQQVYGHNPDGLISGTHHWANYMGNFQWGWAATRPVSDVLIKFDPVTQDYDFGGIKLSPVREFMRQLQIMSARYRVGDGTGSATVTPATSCVQDSSQALYITLKVITQQVASTPAIQKWLNAHPNDPQSFRFEQLVSLGSLLERQLTPLGIVRSDWESNASALTGIGNEEEPTKLSQKRSILAALTSWRTMLPRQAHDELATIFLRQGAKLWFLRTNQVGGWQPDIMPIEATAVFGSIKFPFTHLAPIPILLNRVFGSFVIPGLRDWLIVAMTLLLYSAVALPIGFFSGFLRFHPQPGKLFTGLKAAIVPAFLEELVFRVLMLPHPIELVNWVTWGLWAAFCLLLFVFYHPFNAKTFYKAGMPTFFQPVFLSLTALLGLACTVVYALTGCLWTIFCIHFVILLVWLLWLGGMQRLRSNHTHQLIT